jgi:hypothetical protein
MYVLGTRVFTTEAQSTQRGWRRKAIFLENFKRLFPPHPLCALCALCGEYTHAVKRTWPNYSEGGFAVVSAALKGRQPLDVMRL